MAKARSSSVINVLVAGDTKKFKKALGRASGQLADFGKKVGQIGVATGAAFAAIGAKSVGLAVDFEESLSKSQQIFGDMAKFVEAGAKDAATAVGLSQAEFLEAASGFGIFGKAAGLGGRELNSFSQDLVTLAADVASFNNLRPEEALEKLQAGLRGSNEPLQSIGVLINAAAVETKALEMGLADANGEISEGNKILARSELIYEQLGKSGTLGDFARTSGGLANTQRILTARFKNLGIALGKVLLPIAEKASRVIGKLLTVGEKLQQVYNEQGLSGLFETLVNGLLNIREKIVSTVFELAPKVGKAIKVMGPILAKAVIKITKQQVKLLAKLGNKFIDWIRPKIRPMLSRLLEFVQAAGNFILQKLPFIAEKIGQFAAAFLDWIGPVAKKLLTKMPTIVATIVEFLVTKALPKIVEAGLKLAEHLVPALLSFGKNVLEGIGSIVAQIGGVIGRGFVNMGSYALDQAASFGNAILNAIMKPVNFMGDMVTAALNVVVETFKTVYNTLADLWNNSIGKFSLRVPNWVPKLGGKGFDMPNLPKLADGGIVTGPTIAMIGEAGPEAVIPLNKNMGAMGTTNITVNMPAGASGEDVVQALENYVRRNGSIPLATNNLVRR
jgi:hypothetical protein